MKTKERRKENEKNMINNSAITLIALVVTIVVLIILATVSVNAVFGQNGLISKVEQAKEESVIGKEKEQLQMAYTAATITTLNGQVTEDILRDEIDDILGDKDKADIEKQTEISSNGTNNFNVTFKNTNHNFNINQRKSNSG